MYSEQEALELIKNPLNTEQLQKVIEDEQRHQSHFSGENIEKLVPEAIKLLESEDSMNLKLDLLKMSELSKAFFNQVVNQFYRVISSYGETRQYYIEKNPEKKAEFVNHLKTVAEGKSIQYLMYEVWFKARFIDFGGGFFVELPKEAKPNAEPYIIFKESYSIHDLNYKGREIDYVIFKDEVTRENEKIELFRFVDADKQYFFEKDGNDFLLKEEIEHFFGKVPFVRISAKPIKSYKPIVVTSPIQAGLGKAELAVDAELDFLINRKYNFKQKYYSVYEKCTACDGKGETYSEINNDFIECSTCGGSGLKIDKNPTSALGIHPDSLKEFRNPKDVAGYISAPTEFVKEGKEQVDWSWEKVEEAIFGTRNFLKLQAAEKTATGKKLNLQTVYVLLSNFKDEGEQIESELTDLLAMVYFKDSKSYEGNLISWGEDFNLESEYEILQNYLDAKERGANPVLLEPLQRAYIISKYRKDRKGAELALKKLTVEPMSFYNFNDVKDLPIISDEIKLLKLFFEDIFSLFIEKNGIERAIELDSGVLQQELIKLVKENYGNSNQKTITETEFSTGGEIEDEGGSPED